MASVKSDSSEVRFNPTTRERIADVTAAGRAACTCPQSTPLLHHSGTKLIEYIMSDAARKVKGLEAITNETQAVELCHQLLKNTPQ